jgi:hypothetical protein
MDMDHFEANHMQMVQDNLEAELASSQAEIERLRAALKPFAEGSIDVSGSAVILGYPETSAALDAARAALSGSKE